MVCGKFKVCYFFTICVDKHCFLPLLLAFVMNCFYCIALSLITPIYCSLLLHLCACFACLYLNLYVPQTLHPLFCVTLCWGCIFIYLIQYLCFVTPFSIAIIVFVFAALSYYTFDLSIMAQLITAI